MQLAANDPADCAVGSEEHSNRVVLLRFPSWEKRRIVLGGTKTQLGDAGFLRAPHQKTRFLPTNYRTAASKKHNRRRPPIRQKDWTSWGPSIKEDNPMITNPFQGTAYDAVAAARPFAVVPRKITER